MFKKVFFLHLTVAVLKIVYTVANITDLSTEEAQYWLWSKNLDLSYYSKPPMVAYMNAVSTSILGDTEIGVRINAILLGFGIGLLGSAGLPYGKGYVQGRKARLFQLPFHNRRPCLSDR